VKLLRANKSGLAFQFAPQEKQLLFETLKLYPLVPASHHRLSRDGKELNADENQRLLEEALAEQRRENQRRVLTVLNEPEHFREMKGGFELTLTFSEVEWLLQVLNDVRVGSWLTLGEPEPGKEPVVTEQNAKYLLSLELCGVFQSFLLAALGVRESPKWNSN